MKRPVVLTLAELQKYPTLNHRFAATLPFNDSAVPCECPAPYDESTTARGECQGCEPSISFFSNKAKCIKRTEERWAVSAPSEPHFLAFHYLSFCLTSADCMFNKAPLTRINGIVVLLSTGTRRQTRRTTWHSRLSPLGNPSRDYDQLTQYIQSHWICLWDGYGQKNSKHLPEL